MRFPVDAILDDVRSALARAPNLVVQAPPGAGKTTRLAPALLDAPWLAGKRIVMLEPRRIAARAAARFMAGQRGEPVGETIGYRVRLDSRIGPRTRLEVVTEGVLTRLLQEDPSLAGYGAILFDEFHERSLQADLGLALALEAQASLRPDLRLVVMSATLDGAAVAKLLGDAPLISSEGRAFPVETRFAPPLEKTTRIEGHLTSVVLRALREEEGSVLAFLPGQAEIRRVAELLAPQVAREVDVVPLYGELEPAQQDAAILPAAPGRRKVVLATSIAETSLTIEGVRIVVDSGLSRLPRFDLNSGMSRLETLRVARSAADQRRGRAGRTQSGICYRLWSEGEDARLTAYAAPEILEADLAPLALELAAWGARDATSLAWLDPPRAASLEQARELLQELEALDGSPQGGGAITAHGRAMLALPLHPRLAHMCLRGRELGLAVLAAEVAALLADRDPIRTAREAPDADLRLRVACLRDGPSNRGLRDHPLPPGARIDEGRRHQARQAARDLLARLGGSARRGDAPRAGALGDIDMTGLLVALAYPDRISQGKGGRFRLRNGRGASFAQADALARQPWLAIAALDGAGADGRIYLAAPVAQEDLEREFAAQIEAAEVGGWDDAAGAVVARSERRLGALTLAARERRDIDGDAALAGMLEGIRRRGLAVLPWTESLQAFRRRVALLRRLEGAEWPDLSDEALLASCDSWLAPWLEGRTRLSHLAALPLGDALRGLLSHAQLRALDELAPTHWRVPSGSTIEIDYSGDEPVLAVKLQEMFGATVTPAIARGKQALTLQLLSPARRPVQVTRDLVGFWRGSYHDVRKDLRGRYPKHPWPDDPTTAVPTAKAKRRR
jgi:ATP-dependent helicase HrpB